MIMDNITNINLRSMILVGLGTMIIGLVIVSAFLSISIETKKGPAKAISPVSIPLKSFI
jgi:hypothetical protein